MTGWIDRQGILDVMSACHHHHHPHVGFGQSEQFERIRISSNVHCFVKDIFSSPVFGESRARPT